MTKTSYSCYYSCYCAGYCAEGTPRRLRRAALLLAVLVLPSGSGVGARGAQAEPPPPAGARRQAASSTPVPRPAGASPAAQRLATASHPAPAFTLPDSAGKARSLADYRGQPVVLFFYCGCDWCHRSAQAWSTIQRSGTLATAASSASNGSTTAPARVPSAAPTTHPGAGRAPLTLVVFHGVAGEVSNFARETQLDLKQTVLLQDPEEKISALYQADPCPRVFVVDAQGKIRYTNDEQGQESYKIPAPLIAARTVDALRAVAAKPPASTTAAAPASRQPSGRPPAPDARRQDTKTAGNRTRS